MKSRKKYHRVFLFKSQNHHNDFTNPIESTVCEHSQLSHSHDKCFMLVFTKYSQRLLISIISRKLWGQSKAKRIAAQMQNSSYDCVVH